VNLADLTELALYCERLSAKLFLDNLSLAGRAALNWKELLVSPADYTRACTAINSAMGYEDTGHSLNGGDACILWKYGIVVYLDGEVRVCYDDPAVPRIGSIFEQPLAELLQTKQTLYPAKPSEADCAIKCCLRQRFWEKVSHTLSPSEAVIYFGDSQGAAES
jgi:hypothetical protein